MVYLIRWLIHQSNDQMDQERQGIQQLEQQVSQLVDQSNTLLINLLSTYSICESTD